MDILKATTKQLPEIARLFDLYRQFYDCEADIELAKQYITDRFNNNDSTIFVADDNDQLQGFVQLYPTFCSVQAQPIFVLYDLYVAADNRNLGIGALLMNQASAHAREQGAARLDLSTATTNKAGQHLYEKLGYERDSEFYVYSLAL
jgi:ribosomal protein S18 acetylase RimI-like enzyme|tara:strand:+ start:4275 stop:4715 length:441 start_codon:yes stop_codon:yes gene_type:complete